MKPPRPSSLTRLPRLGLYWRQLGVVAALAAACQTDGPAPAPDSNRPDVPVDVAARIDPVAYGVDDRAEVYAHPDEMWRNIARRSVAALIRPSRLDLEDPTDVEVTGSQLGESMGLCDDQQFFEQVRGASCSATLIAPDLVVTAGHCITESNCRNRRVVFDWFYAAEGELEPISVEEDIYLCDEVVVRREAPGSVDYAVIRLDRPVVGDRRPVEIRRDDSPLPIGTPVSLIGFPDGIPAKIDTGGEVIRPGDPEVMDVFEATVDAFHGNSGSGVFDETGRIVGILVRGEPDYRQRDGEACDEVSVLAPDVDKAEDIVYIERAFEALCAGGGGPRDLCGGDDRGWCFDCDDDAQCRDGWRCTAWPDAPDQGFCAPRCDDDLGCRADHTCEADGLCRPRRVTGCHRADVWSIDRCRRPVVELEACGEDRFCRGDTCADRAGGDACESAFRVEPVSQVIEAGLGSGYAPDVRGSCGGSGPDAIYVFTIERPPLPEPKGSRPRGLGVDDEADAGTVDASATDASPIDAATFDAGLADSGLADSGLADSGITDSGLADTGRTEAGEPDAGEPDAGEPDAGEPDAGEPDSGEPDAELPPFDGVPFTAFAQGFDTVLSVRRVCDDIDTEVTCDDDSSPPGRRGSRIETTLAPGDWYLIVDAFEAFEEHEGTDYRLTLNFGGHCESLCVPGTVRCDEDGISRSTCELDDAGCFDWAPPAACADGERCLGGVCTAPGPGDTCDDAILIEPVNQHIAGDLSIGYGHDTEGSCNGRGPDRMFRFEVPGTMLLIASARGFDSILYLRRVCEDPETEELCNDDNSPPGDYGSRLERLLPAGEYTLILDAYNFTVGAYTLDLEFTEICDMPCRPRDRRCEGDDVVICTSQPEGCPVWEIDTACGDGTRCDDGACIVVCDEICDAGEERCADEGGVERCGADDRGCAVWQPADDCPAGRACRGRRVCVEAVSDAAESDAAVSDGDVFDGASADAGSELRRRGGGGCTITARSGGGAPILALWVVLAVVVIRRPRHETVRRMNRRSV